MNTMLWNIPWNCKLQSITDPTETLHVTGVTSTTIQMALFEVTFQHRLDDYISVNVNITNPIVIK